MGNKESIQSSVSWWFKTVNFVILILGLVALGVIVARDMGNPHPTSGAGEIWWASTPEVIQSYEHLTAKMKE